MEEKVSESAELIKSSGGVFEVRDNGVLIFSKKQTGRFPIENEVLEIIKGVEDGLSLEASQAKAGESAPKPISFMDWLSQFLTRKQAH